MSSSKFDTYDKISFSIVHRTPTINEYIYYIYTILSLFNLNSESVDIFGRVFIVAFVNLVMIDNPKNYVYKVCVLLLLYGLDS